LASIFAQLEESKAHEYLAVFKLLYGSGFPEAVKCLENNWEAFLASCQFPKALHKYIRSTNALEGLFPTELWHTDSMEVF
jgi:transposase-like protein